MATLSEFAEQLIERRRCVAMHLEGIPARIAELQRTEVELREELVSVDADIEKLKDLFDRPTAGTAAAPELSPPDGIDWDAAKLDAERTSRELGHDINEWIPCSRQAAAAWKAQCRTCCRWIRLVRNACPPPRYFTYGMVSSKKCAPPHPKVPSSVGDAMHMATRRSRALGHRVDAWISDGGVSAMTCRECGQRATLSAAELRVDGLLVQVRCARASGVKAHATADDARGAAEAEAQANGHAVKWSEMSSAVGTGQRAECPKCGAAGLLIPVRGGHQPTGALFARACSRRARRVLPPPPHVSSEERLRRVAHVEPPGTIALQMLGGTKG